jgi:hypothetical protein
MMRGKKTFYATYTAYSGRAIRSELIETTDFISFRMSAQSGVTRGQNNTETGGYLENAGLNNITASVTPGKSELDRQADFQH